MLHQLILGRKPCAVWIVSFAVHNSCLWNVHAVKCREWDLLFFFLLLSIGDNLWCLYYKSYKLGQIYLVSVISYTRSQLIQLGSCNKYVSRISLSVSFCHNFSFLLDFKYSVQVIATVVVSTIVIYEVSVRCFAISYTGLFNFLHSGARALARQRSTIAKQIW